MNRRSFVKTLSIAVPSVATGVALGMSRKKADNYKFGLQLFTVRDALAADLKGSLQKISSMGYQDLETYGFDPDHMNYYKIPAKDFSSLLVDLGLTTSSGHYDLFKYLDKPLDEMMAYVDRCIEGAHVIGQRYITWPWLDPQSRTIEKFKLLAERLNQVGERVTKAGLGFAYHNHDFEFTDHNGVTGYDIVMKETDPSLVKLQIDLYWVMHSSQRSPQELFNMQPGRFVMWHIKDMDKQTRDYTELGNGSIDYTRILPLAQSSGLQYYFLEQGGNFASSSMESVAQSADFFKSQLQQYLSK